MALGNPKYGGTNGVPELDLGQPGGALHTAGSAHATLQTIVDGDEAMVTTTHLPELHATYEQVHGYSGTSVVWEGVLRAKATPGASLDEIEANINSYRTGQLRAASGTVTAATERLAPTRLTDGYGARTWETARLVRFTRIGPRQKVTGGTWTELQRVRIEFRVLA